MNFGEGGLRIPKATSTEVKEVVALADEAVKVTTLVASFVRGVNGKGFVLLHIWQPLPYIKFYQIPSNEVT